jgi:hypothetical protein
LFAAQVATDVNWMISDGAARVTALGDEDPDSLLDRINSSS